MSQAVVEAQEYKIRKNPMYLEYQHIFHPKSLTMSNEKVPNVYLMVDKIMREPTHVNTAVGGAPCFKTQASQFNFE
jgi:hypothetical protein